MAIAAASRPVENAPRGILYMVGATALFAMTGAITKWQLELYPPGEVAFLRQIFSLIFCSLTILPVTGLKVFRTHRPVQHLARGVSQFTSQMCLVMALTTLPLGSAMSISFAAPLFAVLLAVVLFSERVGIHRLAALIAGFAGVLLVTEPGAGAIEVGALWALANALLYASVTVAVRRMSATETPETLTMYQMVVLTVAMTALLPFGFTAPEWSDVVVLAVCGYANGLGQVWWTRALHLAPASAVMPFYYLSLVWAMGIGFAVWGEVPTPQLLAGAGIVMASGIYLVWREDVARKRAAAEALAKVRRPPPVPQRDAGRSVRPLRGADADAPRRRG